MNEPEDSLPDSSELSELKSECAQLRKQATTSLIALILLSGVLAAFLFLQVWRTGKDTEALREQQRKYTEAEQQENPSIQALLAKLAEYGRSHPDFEPIMKKYGIGQTSSVPQTATAPNP